MLSIQSLDAVYRRPRLLNQLHALLSQDMEKTMPVEFDFIFIDGDHSYIGFQADWEIVLRRLTRDSILCSHDTTISTAEPDRKYRSIIYFNEVIRHHPKFKWLECCYSLNILRRLA